VAAVLAVVNLIDSCVAHASVVLGPAGAAGFLAVARWAGLAGARPWGGERRRGLIRAAGGVAAVGNTAPLRPRREGDRRYRQADVAEKRAAGDMMTLAYSSVIDVISQGAAPTATDDSR
jgi:hypothetical protein